MKKRFSPICMLIAIGVILTGTSYAKFDLEEALAIWLFDEGEGEEVTDFSGHGNDGKAMMGPEWVDGKFGKALSFDGEDDYVEMNNPVNIDGNKHTISLWVNPGDAQKGDYVDILGNHHEPQSGFDIEQRGGETNRFYHGLGVGGAWQGGAPAVRPATQLTAGVWQHFVVQRDDTTIRHYLNGEKTVDYQIAKEPITPSEKNLRIGFSQAQPDREFKGIIDEVVIIIKPMSGSMARMRVNTKGAKRLLFWM